jgi:hypothetical protein
VQTRICPFQHSPCSSSDTRRKTGGYFNRLCHPEDMQTKDPRLCMPPLFAASAAQSCNPSTNQGPFSVEHSLKLQLQCDTSTCKLPPSLQRAFNCLCGAKRWLGVSFSDACLHCRAAASWPRSCRHYRCTWLTLPLEGIYIEIDLHCMCTVSRHTF